MDVERRGDAGRSIVPLRAPSARGPLRHGEVQLARETRLGRQVAVEAEVP
jgi:hypothetical protein